LDVRNSVRLQWLINSLEESIRICVELLRERRINELQPNKAPDDLSNDINKAMYLVDLLSDLRHR
jgi:hypothetical protein